MLVQKVTICFIRNNKPDYLTHHFFNNPISIDECMLFLSEKLKEYSACLVSHVSFSYQL